MHSRASKLPPNPPPLYKAKAGLPQEKEGARASKREGLRMALMGKVVMVVLVMGMILGNVAVVSMGMTLCGMTDDGIEACRPSVKSENPVDPSGDCCAALSKADIPCLCSYKNSLMLPTLGIDPNAALQLPAKCNLPPPQC